jgi:hypothetical protein
VITGPGGEKRTVTDADGKYKISALVPGKYLIRVTADGFAKSEKAGFDIRGAAVFDTQLAIASISQEITLTDEADKVTVSVAPEQNAGAIVLKEKDLETLSDDPDELSQELQAMAGPGAGSREANCRPSRPSERFESIPIRSLRSTTGPASAASKSLRSPEPILFTAKHSFNSTIRI